MAELGPLYISPVGEGIGHSKFNELLYSGEPKAFPIFGYMDSSLSVIVRFNQAVVSIDDTLPLDVLNPDSYEITGVRVLTVVQVTTHDFRLMLNKWPCYASNLFGVRVTVEGIDETINVMSIVPRPVTVPTIQTDYTDIRANMTGNKAGSLDIQAGDYALAGTIETIRKLVLEIMLVRRGEMLHDVEFGNLVRVKNLQNAADLIEQGKDIRERILALPGVSECSVSAKFSTNESDGIVIFTAKVKTKAGTEFTVNSQEVV